MGKSVNTRTRLSLPSKSSAKLPHERDESVGMTDGNPSEPMKRAYRDVNRGLQDTDRGVEAERAYRKLKGTAPG